MSTVSDAAPVTEQPTGKRATAPGVRLVRRRKLLVLAARLGVAVLAIGGWQLVTTIGWLDPFFFGQPSGIASRLGDFFSQGDQATEFGSFWPRSRPPCGRRCSASRWARWPGWCSGWHWGRTGSWPRCSARTSRS
ncbi:hypothetical protein [Kitasatospora acidiphila]|uniref:hypothetical protein n=1 Tax=Kitasatospora acidiphila TaxID=2567942 RepID=UPI001C670047|nr:hypothetical protein [Kitasatospora acidiphila]